MKVISHHSFNRAAPWLCGLVLAVALAVCLATGSRLKYADETIYDQLGRRLAAGQGFVNEAGEPTAVRPPGYPYVLSLAYRVHASVWSAKFLNVVALGLTVWLTVLMIGLVAPAGRAIGPLLVLAYPLFFYTGSLLYPQTLGSLLFLLAIWLVLRHPCSFAAGLACGATAGALVLGIPAFTLVFAAMYALLLLRNLCGNRLYSWGFLGAFAIAAVLTVTPWLIRNSQLFHQAVYISTNSGINLLYGNSENTGADTGVVDISHYVPPSDLDEASQDAFYGQCAQNWVLQHPVAAARLYALKVANYFNFRNQLATAGAGSLAKDLLLAITYYPLLLAAFVRLFCWRKYRLSWPEGLLYLLYFGNAFLGALVYNRIRYRVPFDFLLIALVAIFFGHLWTRASREAA